MSNPDPTPSDPAAEEPEEWEPEGPEEKLPKIKLDFPPVRAAVLEALEMGCSLVTAAFRAGISPATLGNWMQRGEKARLDKVHNKYRTFIAEARMAQAKGIHRYQAIVANAAQDDPSYAMRMLTILERDHYAEQVTVIIRQDREAVAAACEKEFANEPHILRRFFAALAGVVLPRQAEGASEGPKLIGSGSTDGQQTGEARGPVADGLRSGAEPGLPEAETPEEGDGADGESDLGGADSVRDPLPSPPRQD